VTYPFDSRHLIVFIHKRGRLSEAPRLRGPGPSGRVRPSARRARVRDARAGAQAIAEGERLD